MHRLSRQLLWTLKVKPRGTTSIRRTCRDWNERRKNHRVTCNLKVFPVGNRWAWLIILSFGDPQWLHQTSQFIDCPEGSISIHSHAPLVSRAQKALCMVMVVVMANAPPLPQTQLKRISNAPQTHLKRSSKATQTHFKLTWNPGARRTLQNYTPDV